MDEINSVINDEYLKPLICSASDVNTNLSNFNLRGYSYQNLLEQGDEANAILELSSRLKDCVTDPNRFLEATQLLSYIDQLNKKYSNQVPILESVHKLSECQRKNLIDSLCSRLENLYESPRDNVMQLVNNLIICGKFTARDLKLKYLQARDRWFNNLCKQQGSSFTKLVSVYSGALSMIYEEYKSIFSDSNELLDRNHMAVLSSDSTKEDGAIINSWLLLKTSIFIASLEAYLKTFEQTGTLTPTAFADTVKKCFDLTGRLAAIGFDFSAQLKPLFYQTLEDEIKLSISKATTQFESAFATTVSKSIESLLLPVDHKLLRIANMKPEEQVPKSIDHYPIFKIYCLQLIESLRWLQTSSNLLPPINLCVTTYSSLNGSLVRVMKALAIILNTDNNANHPILSKIAISFITEVLPFISSFCEKLFPEKVLLGAIGLSKSEFKSALSNRNDDLNDFCLDIKSIAEPLRITMPVLMSTIER